MMGKLCVVATMFVTLSMTANAQIGRPLPSPLYGITFDNINKISAKITTLSSIANFPIVRIVFDEGESPTYYQNAIAQFRPHSYVMGELADSSYMHDYTVNSITTWTNNYVNTIGSMGVDLWEIGNEVNGS